VLSAKSLLNQLVALEGRPWSDWFRSDPISARGLAPLDIHSN
tara:strand:- start:226 stop:351 length:126 start_codon:yes stop_codon:yes gene_type:complete